MRTTIDIPEDLLRQAKAEAALRGVRLKELVREALQSHLLGEKPAVEHGANRDGLTKQELAPGCVFPLITGPAGPAMRELIGDAAQRMLDDEDVKRGVHPR